MTPEKVISALDARAMLNAHIFKFNQKMIEDIANEIQTLANDGLTHFIISNEYINDDVKIFFRNKGFNVSEYREYDNDYSGMFSPSYKSTKTLISWIDE